MEVDVGANLARVRGKIARAAERSGRKAGDITLVAVTKTVGLDVIKQALIHGANVLGENKVQEMLEKMPLLPPDVQWHMIGRLQRNKVKYIVDKISLIHSLDRWSLAEEIQKRAGKNNVTVPVLLQVNLAGEDTKSGLARGEVFDFLSDVATLDNIKVRGLMTIAPYVDNPEEIRPVFRQMRQLAEELTGKIAGVEMNYLSMGMTNDFEIAIEEGANMVRIGSALFGPRVY
jgi:hypothetical protein